MVLSSPHDDVGPYNFSAEFLWEMDFSAELNFSREFYFSAESGFSREFNNTRRSGESAGTFGLFDHDEISVNVSMQPDYGLHGGTQRRRKRRPNHLYRIHSIRTSCWYRKF